MQHTFGAVMTFDEIGSRLGISHAAAQQAYKRGLRKLKRLEEVRRMRELAGELQRVSGDRTVWPDMDGVE